MSCLLTESFPTAAPKFILGTSRWEEIPATWDVSLQTTSVKSMRKKNPNTIVLEQENGRKSPALKLSVVQFVHEFVPDQTLFC